MGEGNIIIMFYCVGRKGDKGEKGQNDDTRDDIEKIESSILDIQRNISSLIGKSCNEYYFA